MGLTDSDLAELRAKGLIFLADEMSQQNADGLALAAT